MITLKDVSSFITHVYMTGSQADDKAVCIGSFAYEDECWKCIIGVPISQEVLKDVLEQLTLKNKDKPPS